MSAHYTHSYRRNDPQEHYRLGTYDDETWELIKPGLTEEERQYNREHRRSYKKKSKKGTQALRQADAVSSQKGQGAAESRPVKIEEPLAPPDRDTPRSVSPTMMSRNLVLPTILVTYYDFIRGQGWQGTFSDFMATVVLEYFAEHGYRHVILRVAEEAEVNHKEENDNNVDAIVDVLAEKLAVRLGFGGPRDGK